MSPKTVTEAELADQIAKKLGKSKSEVRQMLNAQQEVAAQALRQHGSVRTPFGSLKVKTTKPQKGGKKAKNPFTGETYITKAKPAKKKIKLSPGGKFKALFGH